MEYGLTARDNRAASPKEKSAVQWRFAGNALPRDRKGIKARQYLFYSNIYAKICQDVLYNCFLTAFNFLWEMHNFARFIVISTMFSVLEPV